MARGKRLAVRKCGWAEFSRYVVDLGMIRGADGSARRVRRFFASKAEAEDFLAGERAKLQQHGESALALSHEDRVLFERARDRLAAMNATIAQAVDFFAEHHKPVREDLTVGELARRCLADKEARGLKRRYLQTLGCSLRSFARGRGDRPAASITREEVQRWVLGNGWQPKTQRNYLGDVRECWAWGVREGFLRANPVAGETGWVDLAPMVEGEIAALSLAQCRALLRAGLLGTFHTQARAGTGRWSRVAVAGGFRPLLGFLAVALFAGVRPEEIARMEPGNIDVRERTLVVLGRSSKTRQRRVIELERAAVAWLRLWQRLCPGAPLVPKNFTRKWRALREAAGVAEWPHDGLRHTFASYHFAAFQNVARLQAMMGHSEREDTLFRHYRAVRAADGRTVTRKAGEEFWGMTPRVVRA